MKIKDDYLEIVLDEMKTRVQLHFYNCDFLHKIFCFERCDLINAINISKAFKNENAVKIYEMQLKKIDSGVIPDIDYIGWCSSIPTIVGRNRSYKTKAKIEQLVESTFYNQNFKRAKEIKDTIICISNAITCKVKARERIEFLEEDTDLEPGSLACLRELVG